MGKNIDLDYGDTAIEPFFDATQELLSTAVTSFPLGPAAIADFPPEEVLKVFSSVKVSAGPGDGQAGLVIEGKYRYITETAIGTYTGSAGVVEIWAVADDNDFSGSGPSLDQTDYAFRIAFTNGGRPAWAALARKVGTARAVDLGSYLALQNVENTFRPELPNPTAAKRYYGPEPLGVADNTIWVDADRNEWLKVQEYDVSIPGFVPRWKLLSGPMAVSYAGPSGSINCATGGARHQFGGLLLPRGTDFVATIGAVNTNAVGTFSMYVGVHYYSFSSTTGAIVTQGTIAAHYNFVSGGAIPASICKGRAIRGDGDAPSLGIYIETATAVTVSGLAMKVEVLSRPVAADPV